MSLSTQIQTVIQPYVLNLVQSAIQGAYSSTTSCGTGSVILLDSSGTAQLCNLDTIQQTSSIQSLASNIISALVAQGFGTQASIQNAVNQINGTFISAVIKSALGQLSLVICNTQTSNTTVTITQFANSIASIISTYISTNIPTPALPSPKTINWGLEHSISYCL